MILFPFSMITSLKSFPSPFEYRTFAFDCINLRHVWSNHYIDLDKRLLGFVL